MTDTLREDGAQVDRLMAERAAESTRAFQEKFETDFLAIGAEVYAATNGPFNINSFPHKIVSAETNGVFALEHLIRMRLAFTKANVSHMGRVFICDPVVEATLNNLVNITTDVTDFAKMIIEMGLSREMKFMMNLYGWDIYTSNRLHIADANDGTTSITGAIYNMCMCIVDDQSKPIMYVSRRMPRVEGERNKDRRRDEFVVTSRYGFGIQRMDTMGTICTHATNIE